MTESNQDGEDKTLELPLRRRAVTFDDCTARGYGLLWPQEVCDCIKPVNNDQGVCMNCGGAIQRGLDV